MVTMPQNVPLSQLRKLADKVTFYRVGIDKIDAEFRSLENQMHTYRARHFGQNEFIMAKFSERATFQEIAEIADIVHALRGKHDVVGDPQVRGLQERGYLLIREPKVIEALSRLIPEKIHPMEAQPASHFRR